MHVTLSPADRAIVEVTIALANQPPRLLTSLFDLERFVKPRLKPHVEVASVFGLSMEDVEKAGIKAVDDLFKKMGEHYHAQLKKWLGEIARRGRGAYSTIAPELQNNLRQGTAWRPRLEDGRVVHQLYVNDVVPGLLAYGTALILDRGLGLAKRLGQCGFCGRFNLTFEGRPRTHCSEAHRLAFDRKMAAKRMRDKRRRDKKRREQHEATRTR